MNKAKQVLRNARNIAQHAAELCKDDGNEINNKGGLYR